MAAFASLASAVSAGPRTGVVGEGYQPLIASVVWSRKHRRVAKLLFERNLNKRNRIVGCNCLASPRLLEEEQQQLKQRESLSLKDSGNGAVSNILSSNSNLNENYYDDDDDEDDDGDVVLKPAPKPLLNARPKLQPRPNSGNGTSNGALGQMLERNLDLELQTSASSSTAPGAGNGKDRDNSGGRSPRRFGAAKSIWRKGDPIKPARGPIIAANAQTVKAKPPDDLSLSSTAISEPASRPQSVPSLRPKPSPAKEVIRRDAGAAPKEVTERAAGAKTGPFKPREAWKKKGRRGAGSSVGNVDDDDNEDDDGSLKVAAMGDAANSKPRRGGRRGRGRSRAMRRAARDNAAMAKAPTRAGIIEVGKEGMLLTELAGFLAIGDSDIIKNLFFKGMITRASSNLDENIVKLLCKEYGVEVLEKDDHAEVMVKKKEVLEEDDLDKLQLRPPVVTVMGHVDHGKTTLLDYIRKSKVTASEAGGITQGIGAYRVMVPMDDTSKTCVFLDTPGHEAFSAMRARGASVTDIVVLVVAADDGVRPQTKEAIAHAKAAKVPIVVAINKIDKEGATPEITMQELSSLGLIPEEWGGDVPMVQVSALTGQNVSDLLETVMLVAELQELKANPDRSAKGTVIEATLHKSRGPLATFLVQNGTLKKGDIVVCGEAHGKVRASFDDSGASVVEAGPSMAVQVIGLNTVAAAGEGFEVVNSLEVAREKAEEFALKLREERISGKVGKAHANLTSIGNAVAEDGETMIERHDLNIMLKVDVQGLIEAIKKALNVLPQDSVQLRFLMEGVGDVSAGDVDLAFASKAMVVGFNVRVPSAIKSEAERKNVQIRVYRVIYDLVDDMRKAMEAVLEPIKENVNLGTAEVKAVFSSGSGFAAGCTVTEGKLTKECEVMIIRKGKVIHKGILTSLRKVKEAVKEVGAGLDCGVVLNDFNDWEVGDKIEAYYSVTKHRTLEEASSSMAMAISAKGVE